MIWFCKWIISNCRICYTINSLLYLPPTHACNANSNYFLPSLWQFSWCSRNLHITEVISWLETIIKPFFCIFQDLQWQPACCHHHFLSMNNSLENHDKQEYDLSLQMNHLQISGASRKLLQGWEEIFRSIITRMGKRQVPKVVNGTTVNAVGDD